MVRVILVDEADNEIGTMEKMEAHEKGLLHRAISVLIFNSAGELLIQKRSCNKYHSAGLWTNTCCSHPLQGEHTVEAARRTLLHEMGIDLNPSFAYSFLYRAQLTSDLIEHEFDYVYTGVYDGNPVVNREEADDWKWMSLDSLQQDALEYPAKYSEWFRLMLTRPEIKLLAKKG